MGISTQQAKLLADGFLDTIGGQNESDFKPTESLKGLIDVAAILITSAQKTLDSQGHVTSGELSDSLQVQSPYIESGVITLNVEALFYYQFLNKGIRGTNGGTGKYSFKSANPSRKMVKSIEKWIQRAGLSSYSVSKSVSNNERKNKTVSQYQRAYAVARSIKQKGIRPTHFFDQAVQIANGYAQDILGKSLIVDIVNSMPTDLGNVKN